MSRRAPFEYRHSEILSYKTSRDGQRHKDNIYSLVALSIVKRLKYSASSKRHRDRRIQHKGRERERKREERERGREGKRRRRKRRERERERRRHSVVVPLFLILDKRDGLRRFCPDTLRFTDLFLYIRPRFRAQTSCKREGERGKRPSVAVANRSCDTCTRH